MRIHDQKRITLSLGSQELMQVLRNSKLVPKGMDTCALAVAGDGTRGIDITFISTESKEVPLAVERSKVPKADAR